LSPNSVINLRNFLIMKGFKPTLKDIDFAILDLTLTQGQGSGIPPKHGTDVLKGLKVDGLTFENCNLTWTNFGKSTFHRCTFKNCSLKRTVFRKCELNDVTFENCTMPKSGFYEARFSGTKFVNCDLRHANFNSANMLNSKIVKCDLRQAYFFEATVNYEST